MRNLGSANTVYDPSSATTAASLGRGGRGPGDIMSLIEDLLRRKAGKVPGPTNKLAPSLGISRAPAPMPMAPPSERAAPTALDRARDAAQLAQYRAMAEPPPKVVRFIGGQRVDTIDPDSLNGAQRQAYLAQNSSFQPSEDPMRAAASAADWERTGRETAVRKRIQGMGYAY